MSRPAPRPRRAARLTGLSTALAATLLLLQAGASHADPGGTDLATSSVVSRLSIVDGKGWLTVQPRIGTGSVTGFEVVVPAAGGSWSGPADIAVPELAIHCRLGPGPDLHYSCGTTAMTGDRITVLPRGGYQVTLPVTRTGSLDALTGLPGQTWMKAVNADGELSSYGFDTFPVFDGRHYRSSAEVRTAPSVADPASTTGGVVAILPITMTIVPGEVITALDVPLPSASMRIVGTNAVGYGIACAVRATADLSVLHCAGPSGAFPAGRYQLVVNLRADRPVLGDGTLALTAAGGTSEPQDSFAWSAPANA